MYSQAGKLLYRETPDGGINYVFLGSKLIAKEGVGVKASDDSIMNYKPFGDSIETPKDDVGYTGHKFDTDLGLSYMQARYYDPVIGRFYSNDPIGFRGVHSFNRYAYANNNPYKYIDPDGRDSIFIARPLSDTDRAQHGFAITTNVDSNGKHSLASRFSYGPVDQNGDDPLRNVTGSGDATDCRCRVCKCCYNIL
jgi:RHS repeat-associated protein